MNTKRNFLPGQKVVCHSDQDTSNTPLTVGEEYTVQFVDETGALDDLIDVSDARGNRYNGFYAYRFELIRETPKMVALPIHVTGEGSVLMANVDDDGKILQVIMAMPYIDTESVEEMVGYCIYDHVGIYNEGFTQAYWARDLFKPIDAATLTFQVPK